MKIFSTTKRDISQLNTLEELLTTMHKIDDVDSLEDVCKHLTICLDSFYKLVKKHPELSFEYMDVLKREKEDYDNRSIEVVSSTSGHVTFVDFFEILFLSQHYLTVGGETYPSTYELESVGNEAIGQVFLKGGIEAFSPKHAILHSIRSTIERLESWIKKMKQLLMEEG